MACEVHFQVLIVSSINEDVESPLSKSGASSRLSSLLACNMLVQSRVKLASLSSSVKWHVHVDRLSKDRKLCCYPITYELVTFCPRSWSLAGFQLNTCSVRGHDSQHDGERRLYSPELFPLPARRPDLVMPLRQSTARPFERRHLSSFAPNSSFTTRLTGPTSIQTRFIKTWVWAMPERAQQLGLMIYRVVDDVTWVEVARDLPEVVPRALPGHHRYY